MDQEEVTSSLRLFNQTFEELSNSSFIKQVRETGHIFVTGGGGATKGYPDRDAMKAFVLTYRFFENSSDRISLRDLATAYEMLPVSPQHRQTFATLRSDLNLYLDVKAPIEVNGKRYTRRQLMRIFIYGNLAHLNRKKKAIYDKWLEDITIFSVIEYNFVGILLEVENYIRKFRKLNEQVLSEIS